MASLWKSKHWITSSREPGDTAFLSKQGQSQEEVVEKAAVLTHRTNQARSPGETSCLDLQGPSEAVTHLLGGQNPAPAAHRVHTTGGSPSLPPNVKVRRKRETHAVESGSVLGISWDEDFNILGLLICDVDNFTIRFCRAAWHCGSGGLCHEDDNTNGAGQGS